MFATRLVPLVLKHITRQRIRSLLTVGGVATAMFLFCSIQALERGVVAATQANSQDTTLIVYRENRYCPFTSKLPQYYEEQIRAIPGVRSVIPMKIVVNNCRASVDVVTFRGVPREGLDELAQHFALISGSLEEWNRRSDAAILGETFAQRRGLKVGQTFDAVGVTVYVAGILRSEAAQDQNVGYLHLDFLQRASQRGGVGIVTQFNVLVDDPNQMETVAHAIDERFRTDPEPTRTRPEKAFVANAARDIVEIVGFTRWLGWGCLVAVLALVANAIALAVRDRAKQYAIFQTIGFRSGLIARMVVGEGILLSLLGSGIGLLAALVMLHFGRFSLSMEGVSINVTPSLGAALTGVAASIALGVLAGLWPAWEASRREIAASFRAV